MSENVRRTRNNYQNNALQPIWNNNFFKYDNHPICFSNWTQRGNLYVKEFFKDNGQFKTLQDYFYVLNRKHIGHVNIRY